MENKNILVDKEQHIWVLPEEDHYLIGITDYAQEQLGDILFVECPDLDSYESHDYLMSLESDKKDQEIFAPFDLKVIEVNEDLEDSPELINEDAFNNWIFKAQINEDDLETLETLDEYNATVG